MMRDFIFDYFKEASNLIIESSDRLGEPIYDAILMMTNALRSGNKILSCGNGGSASDAQNFAAELIGRFEVDRGPLSAIALTTDTSFLTAVANDYDYDFDHVFTRQVKGLAGLVMCCWPSPLLAILAMYSWPSIQHGNFACR
jgi:D-sedoheptulose 7-phosphate isomerase